MSRIFLTEEIRRLSLLPADQVQAYPSAADFPGQPPVDAPATHASITLDPPSSGAACWRSTGLYARAGVPLQLSVAPQDELAQGASPPRIRIGCHTDSLWHLKEWKRCPEISRDWALAEGEQSVCSAFGGLVYVEFSERCGWPRFKIDIDGAVQAPLFVLGRDTPEVWRTTLRNLPGPWAELSTRKVSVTVPSELIRDLDDPEPVLRLWNTISDAAADLAAIPRDRPRAERYVADVQISAGYMHSGYPIMTHLDAAPAMVSVEKLKAGQWGLFHELGHNHQNPDWTFDGTGEVTVNLFSIYICETVCGLGARDGHPALKKLDEAAAEYIRAGSDFTQWKRSPFLALSMYIQLREAFGWEPFKKVFADYLALKPNEHPKTEEEKRDRWLMRMSRAVGRNLGPFFQMWGVPTSDAARGATADLPAWMPPGYPPSPKP